MSRDLGFSIESTRSGKPNLILRHAGVTFPVYSRYDPERNRTHSGSEVLVTPVEDGRRVRVFAGLGLGYHIVPFLRGEDTILVVEPDEQLILQTGELEPVRRVLADHRVTLYGGGDAERFTQHLAVDYDLLFNDALEIHGLPSLRRVPLYAELERKLARQVQLLVADGLTIGRFARRWVVNYIDNSARVFGRRVPLVSSLFGRGWGTVVIAGAGPSLDQSIEDLHRRRERCYLIAVDAAVMPLVAAGIVPDLVVTLDSQPTVYSHFSALLEGKAGASILNTVPVVTSLLSPPPLLRLCERPLFFTTDHPLFRILDGVSEGDAGEAGSDPGSWKRVAFSCSAVSTLAFQVAAAMGFDSIVFVGLDFSYPGLRCYASRSFFHRYAAAAAHRCRSPLQYEAVLLRRSVETGHGKLRTSANLRAYRLELESVIEEYGAGVLRWDTGGEPIQGCRDMAEPPLNGGGAGFELSTAPVPSPEAQDFTSMPILLTLALRERLFKGAGSRREALSAAHRFIEKIAEGRPGIIKFGLRRSDKEKKA